MIVGPEPGLDHGAWTVLMHAYPAADIPVIQLSVDGTQPFRFHYEVGQRLMPLRAEGVLVMGTGNIVHNLRLYDRTGRSPPNPMAERFRKEIQARFRAHDHQGLIDFMDIGPEAQRSVWATGVGASSSAVRAASAGAPGASYRKR